MYVNVHGVNGFCNEHFNKLDAKQRQNKTKQFKGVSVKAF